MAALIFNRDKRFWNPVTRVFQVSPVVLRLEAETLMEFGMATRRDWTADTIRFEDGHLDSALSQVARIEMSEDRLASLKELHDITLGTAPTSNKGNRNG